MRLVAPTWEQSFKREDSPTPLCRPYSELHSIVIGSRARRCGLFKYWHATITLPIFDAWLDDEAACLEHGDFKKGRSKNH